MKLLEKILQKKQIDTEKIVYIPINVHTIKEYLPKINQLQIQSALRDNVIATMEDTKRWEPPETKGKFPWRLVLIIGLCIGLLLLGILIIMYWPQIQHAIQGFMPKI